MPLYRHECESCGHRFRVLVLQGSEDACPTCPNCGSTSTHQLMPLVAVQFKGSGFYKTDRAKKGRTRTEKSGGSDGNGSGNSETKPSEAKSSSSTDRASRDD